MRPHCRRRTGNGARNTNETVVLQVSYLGLSVQGEAREVAKVIGGIARISPG